MITQEWYSYYSKGFSSALLRKGKTLGFFNSKDDNYIHSTSNDCTNVIDWH